MMRATMNTLMKLKNFRGAIFSAACLVVIATVMSACGELTGPTSPSTPTDVKATLASATSATITWKPSPLNDGVISYSIYRNNTKVGESTTTSFTDTGLAQQTTYVYSVAANCKSGVISDRSAETAASTVTTVDVTPPTVVANSVQPPAGSTNVSPAATATVTFSEPMDPATINTTTFSLKVTSGGAAIPGTVTYTAATRTAEFKPTSPLPNPVNITATITTGAKDLAGNALASAFTWSFTTRDDTPPTVTGVTPASGATGVSPNTNIQISFSEDVQPSTITTANITLKTTSGGTAVAGAVAYNATTHVATFQPSAALAQSTSYTLTVTGIKDIAGNTLAAPFTSSFTTGDTNPPTVLTVVPANAATGVAVNTTVKVTFSEPMDPATINTTNILLRNTATSVAITGTVTYDAATNTATFTPSANLAGNTNYSVVVTTGVKDAAGNSMATQVVTTFTTVNLDSTPPTVIAVTPTSGSTNVPTNSSVTVTFSEAMDAATINATTITLRNTATSAAVPGTVTYNVATNTATFTPTGPLSNGTGYTFNVTTGAKDLAGNALASTFVATFTTAAVTDTTAPTIVTRSPTNGQANVAINSNVTVTFSEPMDPATINSTTISIAPTSGGGAVPATVTYNAATNTATLDPTSDLANNTSYTLTVTTGVKDVAGNALAATSTSTFTTVPDTIAPTVTGTSPVSGAANVPVTSVVTVTFSENMDATTINGTTFTLKTTAGSVAVAGTVSYNAATRTATFTPTSNLAAATNYTATVTTGAKDSAGNALAVNASFTFTTQ